MRLFSRLLLVAVLLGGLAYGSYAFGKHVLSSALFAPRGGKMPLTASGSDGSTVVRSENVTGAPRADIDILPPGEEGEEYEPSLSEVRRSSERSRESRANNVIPDDAATRLDNAENSSAGSSSAPDEVEEAEPTEEPTRRPRRRKRRVRETRSEETQPSETTRSARANTDAPARSLNNEAPVRESRSGGSEDSRESEPSSDLARPVPVESPRERTTSEAPERSEEAPRTIRRRERVRRETVAAPARPAPAPARERTESPIPRPEGDTGGSSPVPMPG